MNDIIESSSSKPEIINQATWKMTYYIFTKNLNRAKQIKDYLLENVEDHDYAVFDSYNYPIILYRLYDYNALIDYLLHYDSLEVINEKKIKPGDVTLYIELSWFLPDEFKDLIIPIEESNLCDEYKEILILYLYRLASEIDVVDYNWKNISKRTKRFPKKYPNSRLMEFYKYHIVATF